MDEIFDLTSENLDKRILEFMTKLSIIKIDENKLLSPEELRGIFRDGFGIKEHNIMKYDSENGVLCFDLMICANPLLQEKQQMFYTFFPLKMFISPKKHWQNYMSTI